MTLWGKCYTCERVITEEEENRAHEISGFSLCPVCLEDEIKPKTSCEICGKSGVELNVAGFSEGKKICLACYGEADKIQKEGGVKPMSELKDYVKRNSKTFTLKDGESAEVVYKGYKIGPNKYDPEKECIYYSFETEYGIKLFQSGALGLANIFDTIDKDTEIRITRHGEATKTKYIVEKKVNGKFVSTTNEPITEEE